MISTVEPIQYRYSMNVKLNAVKGRTLVNSVFPNVEDLMLTSKDFENLDQAVQSANLLNTEIVLSLNEAVREERYGILSEINPKHSNQETISKDWGPNEIAKIWIVDKIAQKENPGPIKAVALAQVVETHTESVLVQ
jgi:hypothetical protein